MRSRTKDTVSVRDVHAHAATLIETHLKIPEHGYKCRADVLISILLFAAARMRSIFDACGRRRDAPSDQAVRDALVAMLPDMNTLERRINAGLSAELPRRLTKRSQRLAVDLTLIPSHGQPFLDANEFHWNVLADRHANGCLILRLELLCLTTLTLMLQHAAEHLLGRQEDPATETPDWKPLSIGQQCTI